MTETLLLTIPELNHKIIVAADAIREALVEYRTVNAECVELERDYLHACAVKVPRLKERLAADRERELFLQTEDEWLAWKQAAADRQGAEKALRACEAILSGLQSVAAAHRADAQLAKWGPEEPAA